MHVETIGDLLTIIMTCGGRRWIGCGGRRADGRRNGQTAPQLESGSVQRSPRSLLPPAWPSHGGQTSLCLHHRLRNRVLRTSRTTGRAATLPAATAGARRDGPPARLPE